MPNTGNAVKSPAQRLTVEKRQVKLAKNNADMERWLRRLIRAANEVDRLRRERKRLLKPRPFQEQPEIAAELNDDLPTFTREPEVTSNDDGLDIPAALDRNRKLQAMADPKTKEKKAERKAVEKEITAAELTGKRRKMPLSGKAAMEEILGGLLSPKK